MKKLLMIAAVAMLATVACDKKTDEPIVVPPGAPDATIIAAPTEVEVTKTGTITATLSAAATAEVTIKVANADAAVLTVAATEIKIAAGAMSGTTSFTGVKEGSSKVSFTSATANVKTAELTITVKAKGVEEAVYEEYPLSQYGTYGGLINVQVGAVKIECGTELIDEAGTNCYSRFFATPVVPFATGSQMIVSFSTDAVYDGTEGSGGKTYVIDVYADWNKNGRFEATERIGNKKVTGDDSVQTATIDITVPAEAVASSRVRVVYAFDGTGSEEYIPNESMDSGSILEFMYSK